MKWLVARGSLGVTWPPLHLLLPTKSIISGDCYLVAYRRMRVRRLWPITSFFLLCVFKAKGSSKQLCATRVCLSFVDVINKRGGKMAIKRPGALAPHNALRSFLSARSEKVWRSCGHGQSLCGRGRPRRRAFFQTSLVLLIMSVDRW